MTNTTSYDECLNEAREALDIANNLTPSDAYEISIISERYQVQHSSGGVSPSDLQDILANSLGINNYLFAVIALDGETGNILYDNDDEAEDNEEEFFNYLEEALEIFFDKVYQVKSLIASSLNASQENSGLPRDKEDVNAGRG